MQAEKKISLRTSIQKMEADLFTPIGIYLRLRDRFRDTILLESTDHHTADNSFSFIAIHAIGGIEITSPTQLEYKFPGQQPCQISLSGDQSIAQLMDQYMSSFEITAEAKECKFAQGLYGYTAYDAIPFFDSIQLSAKNYGHARVGMQSPNAAEAIPLMRYRLYQYVIAIDHFRDVLYLLENHIPGMEGDSRLVENIIRNRDLPQFPFQMEGEEVSNLSDQEYLGLVEKGIQHCFRGDVFQIVLSRRFEQSFKGDEFNVYRALRMVNPSPYLFYFDYGDYKLFGSSPESQLIIKNDKAMVHPIAGTFRRTGDDLIDREEAERLLNDSKENAEHVMLVDLARNDLGRICEQVQVVEYKKVKYYSHVIHLVSEVIASVKPGTSPFLLMAKTFPAGTLSGAPKFRAMQLIDLYEKTPRSFYGGAIGFVGFDHSFNHAILIRSFLSRQNKLFYQAGAGVVASSVPQNELQEVNNKLGALKRAIENACTISSI
jgi:anthranilate synthase component 1